MINIAYIVKVHGSYCTHEHGKDSNTASAKHSMCATVTGTRKGLQDRLLILSYHFFNIFYNRAICC